MKGLKNKVALVSAASSGIGKATAKVLSSYGSRVHIFSSNEERVKAASELISTETGMKVNYSVGDMSQVSDVKRVLKEVRDKTGPVDFLIINYGDPKVAPFLDISEEDWDRSINLILKSSIIMTKTILPEMRRGGRVVFITSLTTKQPMENFAISSSLRSAVVSLSKVLSLELSARGINFNSISQGYFRTPRLEAIAKRNAENAGISVEKALLDMASKVPARRLGNPEEIGELVAFLCSEEASYINGTNIQIDGGLISFPF